MDAALAAVANVGGTARQRFEAQKQRVRELNRAKANAKAEMRAAEKRHNRALGAIGEHRVEDLLEILGSNSEGQGHGQRQGQGQGERR